MTPQATAVEQRLRMTLMTVQIEHYRQQMRWEPWRAMAVAFGAGAAFTGAIVTLATMVLRTLGH